MQVELNLTFLLNFSRKLFFDKSDVETFFSSENRLQNRGAHYTQVNTVISVKFAAILRKTKFLKNQDSRHVVKPVLP